MKQRAFKKPGSPKHLDLCSVDTYKKVTTYTFILFMNYTCATKKKLTAATGLLGSHQKKKDKERRIKFITKHVEKAMTCRLPALLL